MLRVALGGAEDGRGCPLELCRGPSAVAYAILDRGRQLGHGAAQGWQIKNGVVAESSTTSWSKGYDPLASTFRCCRSTVGVSQDEDRAKAGAPLLEGDVAEEAKQNADSITVARVRSPKSSGADSWQTAKGIDLQAGIVGYSEESTCPRIRDGFQRGVLSVRLAGLLNVQMNLLGSGGGDE